MPTPARPANALASRGRVDSTICRTAFFWSAFSQSRVKVLCSSDVANVAGRSLARSRANVDDLSFFGQDLACGRHAPAVTLADDEPAAIGLLKDLLDRRLSDRLPQGHSQHMPFGCTTDFAAKRMADGMVDSALAAAALPSVGSASPPILAFKLPPGRRVLRPTSTTARCPAIRGMSGSSVSAPASWPRVRPWPPRYRHPSREPSLQSVPSAARIC